MPWITPMLTVKDVAKAAAFYERAFGLSKRFELPGSDGTIMHAEMAYREGVIMLGPENNTPGLAAKAPVSTGAVPSHHLYLYCDDVDKLWTKATAAGAKGVAPPDTMFWGDRVCRLVDPDGHHWSFATNVADFDPAKAPK
jgi:uncharacterized glyoxalase superfamily protein PhnB